MRVGKDRESWQELECYLFAEMLICVKEKKNQNQQYDEHKKPKPRCTLKGSILIKRHLKSIEASPGGLSLFLKTLLTHIRRANSGFESVS